MISPRPLLLILTAIILVPAATVLSAVPVLATLAALVLLAFVLIVASDAIFFQAHFFELRLIIPEVIRLSKGRQDKIDIKLLNDSARRTQFRVGFPLPTEIGAARNEFDVDLAPSQAQSMSILCEPKQRGRFVLEKCYVQAPTRLRLWNFRRVLPMQSEVRVYPDLLGERRNITALFLRREHGEVRRKRMRLAINRDASFLHRLQ